MRNRREDEATQAPAYRSPRASWLARITVRKLGGRGDQAIVDCEFHSSCASQVACIIARKLGEGGQAIRARVYHSSRASQLACIIARAYHCWNFRAEGQAIIVRVYHSSRASQHACGLALIIWGESKAIVVRVHQSSPAASSARTVARVYHCSHFWRWRTS